MLAGARERFALRGCVLWEVAPRAHRGRVHVTAVYKISFIQMICGGAFHSLALQLGAGSAGRRVGQ